jgi:hypothetical protein
MIPGAISRAARSHVFIVILLTVLTACISVPSKTVPSCSSDTDCNQGAGEVCDEQVCWGNPPAGPFAAIVAPPAIAKNRAAAEYASLIIPSYGWLGDLVVETPLVLTGNLNFACDGTCGDLAVTLTATRSSRISGAPATRTVVSLESVNGAPVKYKLLLPRTNNNDEPYQITVVALPKTANNTAAKPPNTPPLRFVHSAQSDQELDLQVGGAGLLTISGRVLDGASRGISGYRVTGRGKWPGDTTPADVSSSAITDNNGNYQIRLSQGIQSTVTMVAEPLRAGSGMLQASLKSEATNIAGFDLVAAPQLGPPVTVELRLTGTTGNGEVVPAPGVVVSAKAILPNQRPSYLVDTVLGDTATSDNEGIVRLSLVGFQGSQLLSYAMQLQPPASSSFQASFDVPFTINSTPLLQLESRVAVRGIIVDAQGTPLGDVSVTARPSSSYILGLSEDAQNFFSQLALGAGTSDDNGEFVLFVDPLLASGAYDLEFEPSENSAQPRWTIPQAVTPANRLSNDVGPFFAPTPARVRGRITDSTGQAIPGGELRILHPGFETIEPARLIGRGIADDAGIVRLTLPR